MLHSLQSFGLELLFFIMKNRKLFFFQLASDLHLQTHLRGTRHNQLLIDRFNPKKPTIEEIVIEKSIDYLRFLLVFSRKLSTPNALFLLQVTISFDKKCLSIENESIRWKNERKNYVFAFLNGKLIVVILTPLSKTVIVILILICFFYPNRQNLWKKNVYLCVKNLYRCSC